MFVLFVYLLFFSVNDMSNQSVKFLDPPVEFGLSRIFVRHKFSNKTLQCAAVVKMSVRLSQFSDVSKLKENIAKLPRTHCSLILLHCSLFRYWNLAKIPTGSPWTGRQIRLDELELAFSAYFWQTMQDSYCETPIETRMRSVDYCCFRCPWTTLTQISSARHNSTLNISETVQDRHTVTVGH